MTKSQSHLLLSYDETIPEVVLRTFSEMVSTPGLKVVVESRPSMRPQAGIHWLLPTAVVIYVSKAYFDAYLKEAVLQVLAALAFACINTNEEEPWPVDPGFAPQRSPASGLWFDSRTA
jgi:hypothetical protein